MSVLSLLCHGLIIKEWENKFCSVLQSNEKERELRKLLRFPFKDRIQGKEIQ